MAEKCGQHEEDSASKSLLGTRFKWCPTSLHNLAAAETKVLQYVKSRLERFYVPIPNGGRIWTLKVNPRKTDAFPIVMVHGFAAAAGFFFLNFDALAEHRTVYAFDVLGFGQSSRHKFSTKPDVVEEEFVDSIEEWRKGVGLEKFILMGTSFGGFLAASYAIKHPGRVKHLILADPWGFPEKTEQAAKKFRAETPFWMRIIAPMLPHINLLAPLRLAGPFGPQLLRAVRPDVRTKFADGFQDNTVIDYLYHCVAQPPSAETAFGTLQSEGWEWAKKPMLPRMTRLDPNVPITFIYGADTWMDSRTGKQTAILRKGSYVDIIFIQNAGHHMYAEQYRDFNRELLRVCRNTDRTQ
ncbi:(Lyso)-N-acylphosphatidylethanolamine lipase-like isoform X1 [Branchiostoma floridae]|uniref:1-acylglycerol-3-phosphate O-acyltransferase ABHD5 n=1 Tax=Branchiostoma floridae TaxID=7739 RepID=A0A9J7LPK6_BRAFL|nr:(Lyso)-N-acylphosphatidylethanolamine lipase-like isoform X1 [Branchiostoma floridae]